MIAVSFKQTGVLEVNIEKGTSVRPIYLLHDLCVNTFVKIKIAFPSDTQSRSESKLLQKRY